MFYLFDQARDSMSVTSSIGKTQNQHRHESEPSSREESTGPPLFDPRISLYLPLSQIKFGRSINTPRSHSRPPSFITDLLNIFFQESARSIGELD